jgi:hypothetical protein
MLGYFLLGVGATLIVVGYAIILSEDGFDGLAARLSPLNVIGWVGDILTLAPGLGLLWLGRKLRDRSE